jgi:hypothetical protein
VQDFSDCKSRVDIRYLGGHRPGPYGVRVFVDQECIGRLGTPDRRAQVRLVTPGPHKVSVVYARVWRSETAAVNLSPGETVRLECGFERPKLRDYFYPAATNLAIIPLCKFELYLTAITAFGLAFVGVAFVLWRHWISPGGYLILRPLADPRFTQASLAGFQHRPRMTIRRAMVVVAAVAGLLGIAAEDRRIRRRTELDVLRERYRFMAAMHAGQESRWTKQQSQMSEAEERLIKNVEAISILVGSDTDQDFLNTRLAQAKQMLEDHRVRRASYARRADTEAQAREKYLRAAERPWESVE